MVGTIISWLREIIPTVDGRNPASVDMESLPFFARLYPCQVVVWNFFPSTVCSWVASFFHALYATNQLVTAQVLGYLHQFFEPINTTRKTQPVCLYDTNLKTFCKISGANDKKQLRTTHRIHVFWHSCLDLPSRELTYPTLGKGTSSSKVTFQGTC